MISLTDPTEIASAGETIQRETNKAQDLIKKLILENKDKFEQQIDDRKHKLDSTIAKMPQLPTEEKDALQNRVERAVELYGKEFEDSMDFFAEMDF